MNIEKKEWIHRSTTTGEIKTIPSMSGRTALKKIFSDEGPTIINLIIDAIKNIQDVRWDRGEFDYAYRQLMRYTNLKSIITKDADKELFFDRLSEFNFCRKEVLFWLQYSLAMRDIGKLEKSQEYLAQAYEKAKKKEPYYTSQLDDQQAALWLDMAIELHENGDDIDLPIVQIKKLKFFKDASNLTVSLLNRPIEEQSPHPYKKIHKLFPVFFEHISNEYKETYLVLLSKFKSICLKNFKQFESENSDSYLSRVSKKAISTIDSCINNLESKAH